VRASRKVRTMARLCQSLGLVLGIALVLLGCSAEKDSPASVDQASVSAVPTATVRPARLDVEGEIVALGVIKPFRTAPISFGAGGVVDDVAVSVGDQVSTGDVLARLNTDALKLSLEMARQELKAQEAALAQAVSEAEMALKVADWQLAQVRVQDRTASVAAARAGVKELEFELAQARAQDPAPQVTIAQVGLTRAELARDEAQAEYGRALDRPWEPQDVRDAYAAALQQAELDVQLAQARLAEAQAAQRAHAIGLQVLSAQIDRAQADLKRELNTQAAYTITLESVAAGVQVARLQVDNLQAQSEDEPTEAQARLRQAQLAVEQLELQVERATLRAPFDGTVLAVWVAPGESVTSGALAVLLADLSGFYLESTALSQFDIARVSAGQPATVSLDAFPGAVLDGHVSEVTLPEDVVGGESVVYVVRVMLDNVTQAPEGLRWGMTGVARIESTGR
jgi:HlyD family secretion protein